MKKIFCFMIALLFVFSVAPAMAADQNLAQTGGMSLAKMTDQELTSVRGGYVYRRLIVNLPGFSYDTPDPVSTDPVSIDQTVSIPNGTYRIKYFSFVRTW
jgi:hypothetical protein